MKPEISEIQVEPPHLLFYLHYKHHSRICGSFSFSFSSFYPFVEGYESIHGFCPKGSFQNPHEHSSGSQESCSASPAMTGRVPKGDDSIIATDHLSMKIARKHQVALKMYERWFCYRLAAKSLKGHCRQICRYSSKTRLPLLHPPSCASLSSFTCRSKYSTFRFWLQIISCCFDL